MKLILNEQDFKKLEFDTVNPSFTVSNEVSISISVGDRKGEYDYRQGILPRHFVLLTLSGFTYKCNTLEYQGVAYKKFKIEDYEKASILKEKIELLICEQSDSIFNFLMKE